MSSFHRPSVDATLCKRGLTHLAEVHGEGRLLHRDRLVAGDARVDAVHHPDEGLGAGDEGPVRVPVERRVRLHHVCSCSTAALSSRHASI